MRLNCSSSTLKSLLVSKQPSLNIYLIIFTEAHQYITTSLVILNCSCQPPGGAASWESQMPQAPKACPRLGPHFPKRTSRGCPPADSRQDSDTKTVVTAAQTNSSQRGRAFQGQTSAGLRLPPVPRGGGGLRSPANMLRHPLAPLQGRTVSFAVRPTGRTGPLWEAGVVLLEQCDCLTGTCFWL